MVELHNFMVQRGASWVAEYHARSLDLGCTKRHPQWPVLPHSLAVCMIWDMSVWGS